MSQIETTFAVDGNANGHPHVSSSVGTDPPISTAIESDRAITNSDDTLLDPKRMLNLSRQIRTPLASILGMTQMLLGTDLDESQKEFVKAVDASARLIASIVSALADSSKVLAESGATSNAESRRSPRTAATQIQVVEHPLKDDAESVAIETGPPIDPVAMTGLREIDAEDDGFLVQLIDLFLSDMKERLVAMKTGVEARDLGPIRSTAHAVKGSSGHFGAARLAALCRKMELIDPENLARDADGVFAQLTAEADLVRTALDQERTARSASTYREGSI